MKNTQIKKTCITCRKEFFVIRRRINTAKYCSKKCFRPSIETIKKLTEFAKRPKSEDWKRKMSLSKISEKNPMWKGDKAGLDAIHIWVLRNKPKPKVCEICKIKEPKDLANISQKYKRDINDFEWLCRRCHMIKDGRMKNLNYGKNKLI